MKAITSPTPSELADPTAQFLIGFLTQMGLPAENILADQRQRQIIGSNLIDVIGQIPDDKKSDARYLSKFVVGAGSGLFDYSLNAIWNEIVTVLRKKAVVYGIDIFFDAAVGGSKNREFYQNEEDLASLKDIVLLDASRKLELIQEVSYKKLKHMLDMRNEIGISHPTEYSITAFELLSWLETCIQVINDQPTEAALQVQAFVQNIKSSADLIDQATSLSISAKISELPTHLCGNFLRTIFGIFVNVNTDQVVRKNISSIASAVWKSCRDEPKYRLGIVLEGYRSNLHHEKYAFGEQFFEVVSGNSFRSESERSVILDEALTDLYSRHHAWDNFHNEPPVARKIASYLPDLKAIPDNIAQNLFATVLLCRVGNGVNYNNGVSPSARSSYDHILTIAGDKFVPFVIGALRGSNVRSRLANVTCRAQAKLALIEAKKNVINQRLIECLDYLIEHIEDSADAPISKDFEEIAADYFQ